MMGKALKETKTNESNNTSAVCFSHDGNSGGEFQVLHYRSSVFCGQSSLVQNELSFALLLRVEQGTQSPTVVVFLPGLAESDQLATQLL